MKLLNKIALGLSVLCCYVPASHASVLAFANSIARCGGVVTADPQQQQDPQTQLTSTSVASGPACSASSRARASKGSIGIRANIDGGNLFEDQIEASASASARLSFNVAILKPNGYSGGDIPFSFNLDLTGDYSGNISSAQTLDGVVIPTGRSVSAGVRIITDGASQSVGETGYDLNTYDIAVDSSFGAPLTASYSSAVRMVDPDKNVSFSFGLDGGTSAFLALSQMKGNVSAFNSLTFSRTGAVFNLPDGFSIDIPEANVFGNRYFGEDFDPNAVSPVPLPASIWGLVLSLWGIGALRGLSARRQRVV